MTTANPGHGYPTEIPGRRGRGGEPQGPANRRRRASAWRHGWRIERTVSTRQTSACAGLSRPKRSSPPGQAKESTDSPSMARPSAASTWSACSGAWARAQPSVSQARAAWRSSSRRSRVRTATTAGSPARRSASARRQADRVSAVHPSSAVATASSARGRRAAFESAAPSPSCPSSSPGSTAERPPPRVRWRLVRGSRRRGAGRLRPRGPGMPSGRPADRDRGRASSGPRRGSTGWRRQAGESPGPGGRQGAPAGRGKARCPSPYF